MNKHKNPTTLVASEIKKGIINRDNAKRIADEYFKAYQQMINYVKSEDKIIKLSGLKF